MRHHLIVDSSKPFSLSGIPTAILPTDASKKKYNELLDKNRSSLEEYQVLLYASHAKAMLVIFQGMDTAGKDGAIKHVMSGVNPQGCRVVSFKPPSLTALDHDFLWREDRQLPSRGEIGIFNRSYYEETLITRVHPKLLIRERLPTGKQHGKKFWANRYADIVNHENYLRRQGYEIVKIFLHVSRDEQKRRLMDRFRDPKKQWKISEGDVHERAFWKEYQSAHEECIRFTGSKENPWYVVPADDKEDARIRVSQILVDCFKKMRLEYPKLSSKERKQLKKLKSLLKED